MIPTISLLSKPGLNAVKDDTGPVHVDVGMLKGIPRKENILNIRDDLFPVGTKGFKDTVESSFTEQWKLNSARTSGRLNQAWEHFMLKLSARL